MRTNIEIDDKLMDDVMASGDFKTKREAVEAGLQLIKRRHAYAAIRAARGTLFWDDSDEAWTKRRAEHAAELAAEQNNHATGNTQVSAELAMHEPAPVYKVVNQEPPLPSASTRPHKRASKVSKS